MKEDDYYNKSLELIDNVEMSIRLKNNLIIASKKYRFLCELSVLRLYKIKNFGLKSIKY